MKYARIFTHLSLGMLNSLPVLAQSVQSMPQSRKSWPVIQWRPGRWRLLSETPSQFWAVPKSFSFLMINDFCWQRVSYGILRIDRFNGFQTELKRLNLFLKTRHSGMVIYSIFIACYIRKNFIQPVCLTQLQQKKLTFCVNLIFHQSE